jgi:hypothetical protein
VAELEVVDEDKLREIAQWLAAWEWPVTEADSISRAAALGWTVIDDDPGKGQVFETGLLSTRSWAMSYVKDKEVYRFSIFTSPVVDDAASQGRQYVTDAFAAQVGIVADIIGEPYVREPGVDGSVRWRLPTGAVLRVGRTEQNCSWSVDSPWFAELKRDVSQYEDEGES